MNITKFISQKYSILKILLILGIVVQTFSCTTEIEPPPPLSNELSSSSSDSPNAPSSSSGEAESSSSVELGSSSSVQSSSSVAPSSSSGVPSSSSFISGPCTGFVEGTTRLHYGQNKPQFCDERDGKKYVYVEIGTQIWMAENLNYEASGSVCYNSSAVNCTTYGRMYNWAVAMEFVSNCNSSTCASQVQSKHRGICPAGWHLPSDAEWTTLTSYVGSDAGTKLKANSTLWSSYAGTDNYGFSALPGGHSIGSGSFVTIGSDGSWWSSTEANSSSVWYRSVYSITTVNSGSLSKTYQRSVRCLRN